ncbi:MAG: isoleucine--tRNA ligase [Christensenellales bacterium]
MYQKVSSDMDFVRREKEILSFWKENKIFEKSGEQNKGKEPFTFYDGPPTANGKPHIGHILTRCIKDIIPRYRFMQGYDVLRKAGWDTHGLPVELEVERMLGLDGKEQIEQYGVEDFIKECKKSVWKYKDEWERMSDRVGFWADMENPYVTYENNYIESVWWSLKQISDKGLLYKGHKVVPYCPRCGTALSSHEVAQGYQDVKETSIFVKFKIVGDDGYLMAWTTTPWTLPSNVALCVNASETYARAEKDGEQYVLASALVESVLGEDAVILETFPGSKLAGTKYEPLFAFQKSDKPGWFVVSDNYVTLSDGSGIVHIAPAFGEDDARVGRANGLPFLQFVDPKGQMTKETDWEGVFCKDADKLIMKALEEKGLLYKKLAYEHSYPFCWRCDTPLIYYARSSWFIRMTAVKDQLIANNRSVNWLPENIKEGRMGNFLENVVDWGLSRERYWGTPLPVWECGCGHTHVIGSIAELQEMGNNVPDNLELHKPYIDRITLKCQKCGKEMRRVSEVIDCWYDSGSMPFAQWHYPFENTEQFKRRFPADFISEAIDQTRGWFYTLLAISTCVFGTEPFENCVVLGHVQDKDGQKMSKHKGNVVDPWTVLNKQGSDAVRWYFYTGSAPWLPIRFFDEAVSEGQRKFMGTLWNTYAFYILYADIDLFDPKKYKLDTEKLSLMDRWVLSRLHTVIKTVTDDLNHYRIFEAGRELQDFVDELSNWYVRRGRQRYWGNKMTDDKISAYMTLYTVLETVTRLSAPFVPFMSENMYQNIVRTVDAEAPESVHLASWPVCREELVDRELEKNMETVLAVVVLGRACRNKASIKNRQPVSKMVAKIDRELPAQYLDIIAQELNVKAIDITSDADSFLQYRIKPQLKTLGPRYGKLLGKISDFLKSCDGKAVVDALKSDGVYRFELDGQEITLGEEDLLIDTIQQEGYAVESAKELTVALDTVITPELKLEGYLREMISKVQTMRREAGFDVVDHIRLYYVGSDVIRGVMERYGAEVALNVLADEIKNAQGSGYTKEWDINGEAVTLTVEKVC